MLAFCLALQDVDRLIDDLADDSIEVRDAAEGELLKIGDPAEPALRRALPDSGLDRRSRIEETLLHIQLAPLLKELAHPDEDRWTQALRSILAIGPRVVPLLRAVEGSPDYFRASQVADILDGPCVGGLRFGIVSNLPWISSGETVPGWEVFMNVTSAQISIETVVDASVSIPGNYHWRGGMNSTNTRQSARVVLEPGAVILKRRRDLLIGLDAEGVSFGPVPDGPGPWRLIGAYEISSKDAGGGCWSGRISGNSVFISRFK